MLLQVALFCSIFSLSDTPHLFSRLSVDEYLGFFHIFVIVINDAMNIGVHVSFQISVFIFFEHVLRSETL